MLNCICTVNVPDLTRDATVSQPRIFLWFPRQTNNITNTIGVTNAIGVVSWWNVIDFITVNNFSNVTKFDNVPHFGSVSEMEMVSTGAILNSLWLDQITTV